MSDDDEELQLAIELSRKTFEDEQRMRSTDTDLIRFESPDESARQKKISKIKQVYESNVAGPSNSINANQFGFPLFYSPTQGVPGLLSHSQSLPYSFPSKPTEFCSSTSGVIPPPRPPKPSQYKFPPPPSINTFQETNAPLPPLFPRVNRNNTPSASSTSSFTQNCSTPAHQFNTNVTSAIKPFDISHSGSEKSLDRTRIGEESASHLSRNTEVQYQPLTYLYVPYVMPNLNSSYDALLNGDLIDLSCPNLDETANVSLEEIRNEFDPLYFGVHHFFNDSSQVFQKPDIKQISNAETGLFSKSVQVSPKQNSVKNIEFPSELFSMVKKSNPTSDVNVANLRLIKRARIPFYFIAPTVNYMTTAASSVKINIYQDLSWKNCQSTKKAMTCDIEETIDLITAQALSCFDLDASSSKEYGLKIYGLNQYLAKESKLGSNSYTGHCLLHGEDVKLEIGVLEPETENREVFNESWEKMKAQVRYATIIDKEDVENIFSSLSCEMSFYENAFDDGSTLKLSQTSQKVKHVVMNLCRSLHEIVPEKLFAEMQCYLAATTATQLWHYRNNFLREVHSFLELYCRCTVSEYRLPPLQSISKPEVEVLKKMEFLHLILDSVHSIPDSWIKDYTEFYMSVDLYYGTQVLDGNSNKTPKTVKVDQFFPRIHLDLYANFKRLHLCTYPRETRIVVSISGTMRSIAQVNEQKQDTIMLAYCSVPLYDENMHMRQGPLFLPLTLLKKQPIVKPFGPYPFIKDAGEPILLMHFKMWEEEIVFPNVNVEMQCIPQDFSTLDIETQEYLLDLIENKEPSGLEADEQELIWQKRLYLTNQPEALPLVLSSLKDWSYGFVMRIYQILEEWAPLKPETAMELLLPQYPDNRIRSYAVQFLASGSTDFLFHTIPQFIEALRFELYETSAISNFVLELAMLSLDFTYEIYWQLQQRIDHCAMDDLPYAMRCQNLQQKIVNDHENSGLKNDIKLQHELLQELDSIQDYLRKSSDPENDRLYRLRTRLGILDAKLLQNKVRLPICPAFNCVGVRIEECNIFNSNAKPLKIVFRGISIDYSIIHKHDDDMRQDAFVMKMVNEMDRIWKSNGLDLRIITFRVMPVGYRRGMGELVLNCATLLEIQKEDGLRGVLNDEVLRKWLMKHNSNEFTYKEALENFIRSCAGWCIATYVLGIGDRHNDNILFTKNGHVFHIDFGKYMGDWQMAGGFRRDRVPFVFTSEMFYVINGGKTQTQNYQKFLDYCCKAFNYLRNNSRTLINLLKIMACSDISGINLDSMAFVEKNLMLDLSDTDAIIQFTELVQNSLNSSSVRLNFVAHTVAQFISSSGSFSKRDMNKLSFVPELYTEKQDGRFSRVTLLTYEKRFIPNKIYLYKLEVCRQNENVSSMIYRSFAEFEELHSKLRKRFPCMAISLNSGSNLRSNVRAIAQKRMIDVQRFLNYLFQQQVEEICHCDLVYTFFHSILRDNKCDTYSDTSEVSPYCLIFLKVQFNSAKEILSVFIGHVKNLALQQTGQPPDSYVKSYVRPDVQNFTKRKTQIVKATQNPTFNQELLYQNFPETLLSSKVLEISVWNNGGLKDNYKMYMTRIPLLKVFKQAENRKAVRVLEGWFQCDKYI